MKKLVASSLILLSGLVFAGDPFVGKQTSDASKEEKEVLLDITGFKTEGNIRSVLIEGRWYSGGSRFGDIKVMKISKCEVLYSDKGVVRKTKLEGFGTCAK